MRRAGFDISQIQAMITLTMSGWNGPTTMAENETLHLGDKRNRRWRLLCEAVCLGMPPEDAAKLAGSCVNQVVKNLLRYDPIRGGPQIPMGDILGALRTPSELARILENCDGHQYAHLLAEERGAPSSEVALERYFGRVLRNFLDQVAIEAVPSRFGNFARYEAYRTVLERDLAPEFRALAKRVAHDPSRPPRSPPRSRAVREAEHGAMLRESLLPRSGMAR
jgi:hypothetical protein